MLYAIYLDAVLRINPYTYEITKIKENIPEEIALPGRCVVIKNRNGDDGILTRYGVFYNIRTSGWEYMEAPPYHPWSTDDPNAMYLLNGKATIFGSQMCDEFGNCKNNKILQYDVERDDWDTIGEMRTPRSYHTVVRVPAEYCDAYVDPSQTTTLPPDTTTTTTARSTTTAPPASTTTTTANTDSGAQTLVLSFMSIAFTLFSSLCVF